MILDGTDEINALENMTVSGGRLNLYNTAITVSEFMISDSLDPKPVINFIGDGSDGMMVHLNWNNPETLFGGDSITKFENDLYRDGNLLESLSFINSSYDDSRVLLGNFYEYTMITRLVDNDSISVPVSILVELESEECPVGESNIDGSIDIMDIIKTMQFILKWDEPISDEFCAANVDFDNTLTINDLLLLSDLITDN